MFAGTFAEPCCGDGALIRHLEAYGLCCVYSSDIETGQDALALTAAHCNGADAIITNTPYVKPLMHELIAHFQTIMQTSWLLFEQNRASTKHARPFLASCSDIVAIGQLKWIAGSKFAGFEHYAWYR